MLYMVELHYRPEQRDEALKYFQAHGLTHYEGGVSIKDAWVATRDHIAYVVASSNDAARLEQSCEPLSGFGTLTIRPVTDMDRI
ncbi:MAG: hypothetical protein OES79_05805 [Planctomycetota bacterium]|nr:hypothetical protein [Planctomycetota bacterium]